MKCSCRVTHRALLFHGRAVLCFSNGWITKLLTEVTVTGSKQCYTWYIWNPEPWPCQACACHQTAYSAPGPRLEKWSQRQKWSLLCLQLRRQPWGWSLLDCCYRRSHRGLDRCTMAPPVHIPVGDGSLGTSVMDSHHGSLLRATLSLLHVYIFFMYKSGLLQN